MLDFVSILVFVELALDDNGSDSGTNELVVSILVFVELALDEKVFADCQDPTI